VLLLAPYAPHIAEELWSRLGHSSSLAYEPWPEADESLLVVDTVNLPVQVGARKRFNVFGCASWSMVLRTHLCQIQCKL
jgi:leucyl-tRNA synthetase